MTQIVQEWNAEELIAEISGRVVNGMDRACQFAAGETRARAPKRTSRMEGNVDYEVVARGNEIEGRVGMKGGKPFYWKFVEFGTRKMPAHPFIRPAVFENAATIVRLIEKG